MGVQVIPISVEVVSHSLSFPFPISCFIPIPIGNHIPMHIFNLHLIRSAVYLRAQITIIITRTITIRSSSTMQTMIPANAPASIKHILYHQF